MDIRIDGNEQTTHLANIEYSGDNHRDSIFFLLIPVSNCKRYER
jgi:hypothetical protein